jgi:hypothetical protein
MKGLVLALALLIATSAAYGQGQFFFNTHDLTEGNVLYFVANGVPASGNDLFAEVWAGPDAQHTAALTPLLALNRPGAGAGFTSPFSATYIVPGMTAGQTAIVGVIGFQGTSSDTAINSSGLVFLGNVVLTEPPTPPNEAAIGTKIVFITIDEPGTWSLVLIGFAVLLVWRRGRIVCPSGPFQSI